MSESKVNISINFNDTKEYTDYLDSSIKSIRNKSFYNVNNTQPNERYTAYLLDSTKVIVKAFKQVIECYHKVDTTYITINNDYFNYIQRLYYIRDEASRKKELANFMQFLNE